MKYKIDYRTERIFREWIIFLKNKKFWKLFSNYFSNYTQNIRHPLLNDWLDSNDFYHYFDDKYPKAWTILYLLTCFPFHFSIGFFKL